MKPVLSVIVPIYNQEKYVEECLDSLFSQATDQVEFILMNDGSTDSSPALCEKTIRRYTADARLINQTNHGLLKTRKIGLEAAKGDYILFVDSDDKILDGALGILLKYIQARHPDLILFNATNDPVSHTPMFSYDFTDEQEFSAGDKYPLYQLLCATDKMNNIWSKCIRRELLLDPEVYEDIEGISNGEDLYQTAILLDRAQSILFLDRVLYYYRVDMNSMSRSYNPKHFLSEKKVCARRLKYAEKWSRNNGELVKGAEIWICKILRDVTRKAFICDKPWPYIREEIKSLRGDSFYQQYYFRAACDPSKKDIVLKSSLPVMRVFKLIYAVKPWLKRAGKSR